MLGFDTSKLDAELLATATHLYSRWLDLRKVLDTPKTKWTIIQAHNHPDTAYHPSLEITIGAMIGNYRAWVGIRNGNLGLVNVTMRTQLDRELLLEAAVDIGERTVSLSTYAKHTKHSRTNLLAVQTIVNALDAHFSD